MAPSGSQKKPYWRCRCGFDTNWASNIKCHSCGDPAPVRVRAKAEALAQKRAGNKPPPKAVRKSDDDKDEVKKLKQQLEAERVATQPKDTAGTSGDMAALVGAATQLVEQVGQLNEASTRNQAHLQEALGTIASRLPPR